MHPARAIPGLEDESRIGDEIAEGIRLGAAKRYDRLAVIIGRGKCLCAES